MDSKTKGKTWVGSIYQKFEAMCQDVDDFVSKDTVKYVGNQVQTVGVGVKKFYSDVVQDLLPPADPVKCKAQVMTEKQNDAIRTYIRSIVGIKEKSSCVTGEKTTREHVVDHSEYCSSPIQCEPDHETEFLCPLGTNPSEEAETDLAFGHNGGAAVNENPDIGIDKNVGKEEQPVAQDTSSSEDRNFSELSLNSTDHYHTDTTLQEVSSPTSLHDSDISIDQNVGSEEQPVAQDTSSSEDKIFSELSLNSTDHYHIDTTLHEVSSPTSLHDSDISIDKNVGSKEQPVAQDTSSSEDRNSSELSLNSADHHDIDTTLHEVSSPTSLHDSGFKSPQEDRTICNSSSDEIECVQSNISSYKEIAGPKVNSCSASLLTESVNMSESFHANSTQNAEDIGTGTVGHASNISTFSYSASVPTLASDNEHVGMLSTISNSFSSSLSNDAYRNHGSSFLVGSSESRNEEWSDNTQLKALMSSSVIGRVDDSSEDVADPCMETIDLSDKAKVNESCIVVDNKLVFPVSSRARRFRSYKTLLKDAFSVRKRLTKEYEQLAIWYGDIDAEASQHFESPSSSLPASIHSSKSPTHDMWESEWELL